MLVILSPTKTLNLKNVTTVDFHTEPQFLDEAENLVKGIKGLSEEELGTKLKLSSKLAALNYKRYSVWQRPFSIKGANQALLAFSGSAYKNIGVHDFTKEDYDFAQGHLRILSGLYGLLRPMDLILPYRLDLENVGVVPGVHNLYDYWSDKITEALTQQLGQQENRILINLASKEYFKVIDQRAFKGEVITPVFKERKGEKYRVIGTYAKKARGLMTRYIIKEQLEQVEDLKGFNEDGYQFNRELSTELEWVFSR